MGSFSLVRLSGGFAEGGLARDRLCAEPTATVRLSASVNFTSTGSIYLLAVSVIPAVA